ncbi:bacteriocin class II family protein [uncultured Erythrobacter sp.]|uniref:bacteriocin class II family protein n=1 Tax=uncultured Erythrobacter sp. TaxID=263913 RepID=UPI00262957E2|nr:bacteriocin class II family protein [uncultured Erythrobacter sp.]
MTQRQMDPNTEQAIRALESSAINFAYQFINISSVRSRYIQEAQKISESLRNAYRSGEMSARAAAESAHGMRNKLLDVQRARSASLGRALARNLKANGLALDDLLERLSRRLYDGKTFSQLDNAQQTRVYLEVVESAGRPRASATRFAARAGAAGRALFLIGIGIAVYNIANAEDPAWQTGREVSNIAGGLGGSIAAGALAGVWLGPVGVAVGAFVGGVAGALLADQAYVAAVGPSDQQAGAFIDRFTSFWSTDEVGLARAMYREIGIDLDRVHAIFLALDESYTSDVDEIALLYSQRVLRGGGNVLQALRLNSDLRNTLIRVMDEGWTTSEERQMMARLRALR